MEQEYPPMHTTRCRIEQDDIFDLQKMVARENFRRPRGYIVIIVALMLIMSLAQASGIDRWYLYVVPSFIIVLLINPLIWRKNAKKEFNRLKDLGQLESEISFYDTYFAASAANGWQKTEYKQLNKICVSDKSLFLMLSPNTAYIVHKESLTDEMIEFLTAVQTASSTKNTAKRR